MNPDPSTTHYRSHLLQGRLLFSGFVILLVIACSSVPPLTQATQTPFVITATVPASTSTIIPPTPSATTSPISLTSTVAASCAVLQQLNLRSGPGTAYNPPIIALETGTEFVPIGFEPQGVPGGTWVQARVDSLNRTGWVSAGEQFVSCNLELSSLPRVEVPPPPKPAAPRVGTGAVDGDNISSFRFSLDYNRDYFVRMYVFRSDNPDEGFTPNKDGRGITSVEFRVTSPNGNQTFYESTERNAGYCIFGGGEPDCNPWVLENGEFRWGAGGGPVVERNYKLTITVTADDGEVGVWFIDISVTLP